MLNDNSLTTKSDRARQRLEKELKHARKIRQRCKTWTDLEDCFKGHKLNYKGYERFEPPDWSTY